MRYIECIKGEAEQYGVIKIVPPKNWKVDFALDEKEISFKPRVQVLSELEGRNRARLIFLNALERYWTLQGMPLHQAPVVRRQMVDLYGLAEAVKKRDGYAAACSAKAWPDISAEIGFTRADAYSLKSHYKRLVKPFLDFEKRRKAGELPKANAPRATIHSHPEPSSTSDAAPATSRIATSETERAVPYTAATDAKVKQAFAHTTATMAADELVAKACRDIGPSRPKPSGSVPASSTASTARSSPVPVSRTRPKLTHHHTTTQRVPPIMRAVAVTAAAFLEGGLDTSDDDSDDGDEAAEDDYVPSSTVPLDDDDEEDVVVDDDDDDIEMTPTNGNHDDNDDNADRRTAPKRAKRYTPTHRDLRLSPVETDDTRITLSHGGTRPPRGQVEAELGDEACEECRIGDYADLMLLCDQCDRAFHTFCLEHPLSAIPRGDWLCPVCTAEACAINDVHVDYGFQDSDTTYSIHSFRARCDRLEKEFIYANGERVSQAERERRFWHAVTSPFDDERLPEKVEYGADLQTLEIGSGFATRPGWHANAQDTPRGSKTQAAHPWNLNNWPIHRRSLFRFIEEPVSGVKVPWLYVGQLFSSFCWHIEDHWCYSVNYMHRGQPKTWYGVPAKHAPALEQAMLDAAPDLFEKRPDLLHDLVTLASPSYLADKGVDVYRVDQHPGEFIVTFPRAYHAGFNNGFNVAEAVNFAPAHWLEMGRECFERYRSEKRRPVFNHWELVLLLAQDMSNAADCDALTAGHLLVQLGHLLSEETTSRQGRDWDIVDLAKLDDDARVCRVCNTTCYTSVRRCQCSNPFVCASHSVEEAIAACSCAEEDVKYQVSIELEPIAKLIEALQSKAGAFDAWLRSCPASTPITTTLQHPQLIKQGNASFCLDQSQLTTVGEALPTDEQRLWLPVATTEPPQLPDDMVMDEFDADISLGDALNTLKASLPASEERIKLVAQHKALQAWLARAHADWRWDPSYLAVAKVVRHVEALDNDVKEFVRVAGVHRAKLRRSSNAKVDDVSNRRAFVKLLARLRKLHAVPSLDRLVELGDRCLTVAARCANMLQRPHGYSLEDVEARIKEFETLPMCMHPVQESMQDLHRAHLWQQKVIVALAEERLQHQALLKLDASFNKEVVPHYASVVAQGKSKLAAALEMAEIERRSILAHLAEKKPFGIVKRLRTHLKFDSAELATMDKAIARCEEWLDAVDALASSGDIRNSNEPFEFDRNVYYDRCIKLVAEGEALELNIDECVRRLRKLLAPAEMWLRKATKLFAPKENTTLDSVLGKAVQDPNFAAIDKKRAASAKNAAKKNARFCKCNKPEKGVMVGCGICDEWFHCRCINVAPADAPFIRFVCQSCMPCRKPTMSQCQDLMAQMSSLPMQLSEAGLLARLVIKANAWVQDADAVLSGAKQVSTDDAELMVVEADLLPIDLSHEANLVAYHTGISDDQPPPKKVKAAQTKGCACGVVATAAPVLACLRCSALHHLACLNVTPAEAQFMSHFICASCQVQAPLPVQPPNTADEQADLDEDSSGKVYCYCREEESDDMVMCDWCSDWFHSRCIGLTSKELKKLKHFACARCVNLPPIHHRSGSTLSRYPLNAMPTHSPATPVQPTIAHLAVVNPVPSGIVSDASSTSGFEEGADSSFAQQHFA
eukprot:TRINITY_DN12148_c1_g1_i1.p1 TRINITY_DN12148_c1_g1~~TRINITY_DN12148_c1_g1_i1.p1  ORF type:complete len:1645 (+),score=506.32 TRINITY_DN12148_c1_g1_i1:100-5034(+)